MYHSININFKWTENNCFGVHYSRFLNLCLFESDWEALAFSWEHSLVIIVLFSWVGSKLSHKYFVSEKIENYDNQMASLVQYVADIFQQTSYYKTRHKITKSNLQKLPLTTSAIVQLFLTIRGRLYFFWLEEVGYNFLMRLFFSSTYPEWSPSIFCTFLC